MVGILYAGNIYSYNSSHIISFQDKCQNYIRVLGKWNGTYYVCGTNAFEPKCRLYKYKEADYPVSNELFSPWLIKALKADILGEWICMIFRWNNAAIFILGSLFIKGQLLKERICSSGSKFFPWRLDPFCMGVLDKEARTKTWKLFATEKIIENHEGSSYFKCKTGQSTRIMTNIDNSEIRR